MLKSGMEPESFLVDAPVAVRLYRNLQTAVERELDDQLITRMRKRERQVPVEELSEAFKHLTHKDEEKRNEVQCRKDGKVLEETGSVRTKNKTRHRTRKSKCKKQENASKQ